MLLRTITVTFPGRFLRIGRNGIAH
jgi:hypothetical protein